MHSCSAISWSEAWVSIVVVSGVACLTNRCARKRSRVCPQTLVRQNAGLFFSDPLIDHSDEDFRGGSSRYHRPKLDLRIQFSVDELDLFVHTILIDKRSLS
jgi:hypothetical protein